MLGARLSSRDKDKVLSGSCFPMPVPSYYFISSCRYPASSGWGNPRRPSSPSLPHPPVLILPFLCQAPYILEVWSCLEQIPSYCASVSHTHTENWDSLATFPWEPELPDGKVLDLHPPEYNGCAYHTASAQGESPCLGQAFQTYCFSPPSEPAWSLHFSTWSLWLRILERLQFPDLKTGPSPCTLYSSW